MQITKQGQLEVKPKMERREEKNTAEPCYFEDTVGFENFPTQN